MLRIHNCCKLAFWCALDSVATTLPGSKESFMAKVDQRFVNPRTTHSRLIDISCSIIFVFFKLTVKPGLSFGASRGGSTQHRRL